MLLTRPIVRSTFTIALGAGIVLGFGARIAGRVQVPTARLVAAPRVELPSSGPAGSLQVDSNSPGVWEVVDGEPVLHVLTSVDGFVSLDRGLGLDSLEYGGPSLWDPIPPAGGVWMESVLATVDGVWYGYYHEEIAPAGCRGSDKIEPRIGAARSTDHGRTWQDLGIILSSPFGTVVCGSRNRYFVGGVGDFSAVLDGDQNYVYLLFSQYVADAAAQGVAIARFEWAARDEPVGHVTVMQDDLWIPAEPVLTPIGDGETSDLTWQHAVGTPLFWTGDGWHDGNTADAFWGPSVHWNAYLEQYVMLLSRTRSPSWDQEGVYVSFNPDIADLRGWSTPHRVVQGGRWYPQVMGLERGVGSDRLAGQRARFFMGGESEHLIEFQRPAF